MILATQLGENVSDIKFCGHNPICILKIKAFVKNNAGQIILFKKFTNDVLNFR